MIPVLFNHIDCFPDIEKRIAAITGLLIYQLKLVCSLIPRIDLDGAFITVIFWAGYHHIVGSYQNIRGALIARKCHFSSSSHLYESTTLDIGCVYLIYRALVGLRCTIFTAYN